MICFVCIFIKLNAQDFCLTPSRTNTENRKLLINHERSVTGSYYFLRTYFHVIRNTNGTGGVSYSSIQSAINMLNGDFSDSHIVFVWNGVVDYIDNSNYYNSTPSESIYNINNHNDGIDIYLFRSDYNKPHGLANGIGTGTELYLIGSDNTSHLCTTHVISHEMGHILNLFHTHHGTFDDVGENGNDPYHCKELVNGSNSDTCGDYIEDTPADPNLLGKVNSSCIYTGTDTDVLGQPYSPDVHLIMSYTTPSCMSYFSDLQMERMRAAIQYLPSINCCLVNLSVSGSSYLCDSNVYSITNLPMGASVAWSLINGSTSCVTLQANSPSTNQCTLTLNNPSNFNLVTLKAEIIMNGVTVKTIQKGVGKPFPFAGTYEEAAGYYNGSSTPAISQTPITDPSGTDVYIGGMVTVRSTYFSGKTITTTGPYGYYNRSGNKIDFSLCSQNEYQPFTIIVHEQGCDDEVSLMFLPYITLDGLSLGITPIGSRSYEVSLSCNKAETTEESSMDKEDVLKGKTWTLEAYNAITAHKTTSIELKEPTYVLDTTGWESGLYLLRTVVGDKVLTGKITVP